MPPATPDLAATGYTEAIRLMRGGLLHFCVLWRPEAFERFRTALKDGRPDPAWMEQFNQDLQDELGPAVSARFIEPGAADYPDNEVHGEEPVAVVRLHRTRGNLEATFIIRPEAEQVLEPIVRMSFVC